eukprot:TRINITY_DN5864_c0_g4_i1.p1 TRINITY_DN5864_c0_g4~~TRINITY_DN5864_c0_g4_i1.p1  ORF type:complete len:525 (-),score=145.75 TRINITY_DN5864_c0_g4_i1:226-1800(-)
MGYGDSGKGKSKGPPAAFAKGAGKSSGGSDSRGPPRAFAGGASSGGSKGSYTPAGGSKGKGGSDRPKGSYAPPSYDRGSSDRGYDSGRTSYAPPRGDSKGGSKGKYSAPPPRSYDDRGGKGGSKGSYDRDSGYGGGYKRDRDEYEKGSKGGSYGSKGGSYSKGGGKTSFGKGDRDKGGDKGGGKGAKGGSVIAKKLAAGEKVYSGVVRLYNPDKKHGYVDSPDVQWQWKQDVYAFEEVLVKGNAGPGDRVAFFLHWSAKGQPQASHPLLRINVAAEGQFAQKGTFKASQSDFGFIKCDETKEYFGRDVYVNKELAAGLEEGQTVCFNAYLNRDGMPNAESCEPCEETWEPPAAELSEYKEVETGKGGKGKGKGEDGAGDSGGKGGKGGAPELTGKVVSGTIKSFNSQNNYGFIECEEVKSEYGRDTFVHGKEFSGAGLNVGDTVQFEVAINAKGQPQAMNIEMIESAADAGGGEPPAKRQKADEDWNYNSAPADGANGGDYNDAPPEGDDGASFADLVDAAAAE